MSREAPDAVAPDPRTLSPLSLGLYWLLAATLFATGAASLLEEILWARMLHRLLGSTSLSVATVLAGFLGGLAAGGLLASRYLSSLRHPLRVYGALELISGGAALLFTALLDGAAPLAGPVYGPAVFLLLLIAFTVPIGMGFPVLVFYLSRALAAGVASVELDPGTPRAISVLYGVNALGGAVGALLAGFGVIPAFGEVVAIHLAVGLQVAAGVTILLVARSDAVGEAAGAVPASPPPADPVPGVAAPIPAARAGSGVLHLFLLLSGLVALYWEVLWTRILVLVVGSSVYALSMVTAGVVAGIGIGSLLFRSGRLMKHGFWGLPLLLAWLLVPAFTGVPCLPDAYLFGVRHVEVGPLALGVLGTGAIVLVPALLTGTLFPWGVACAPRRCGTLVAANSVGAALGAYLAGPLASPFLGLEGAFRGGVYLVGLLAICGAMVLPRPRRLPAGLIAGIALAPGLLLWIPGAGDWDRKRLLSGVYQWSAQDLYHADLDELAAHREILAFREGREVLVTVERGRLIEERADGQAPAVYHTISIRGNGKAEGSVPDRDHPGATRASLPTQVLLGAVPALLRPGASTAIIGLGSGVTLGTAVRGGLQPVLVLEIEEAFLELLGHPAVRRHFEPYLGEILDDARASGVEFLFGDARRLLTGPLRERRWDVLVSQPSEPWIAGSAPLFTREFFELAADRLNPDGLFVQWVQLYKLDSDSLRLLIRTVRSVFNRIFILRAPWSGELILVCSRGPIQLPGLLRPITGALGPLLAEVDIGHGEDLVALFLLGPEGVQRLVEAGPAAPVNTDRFNRLEFRAPRLLHRGPDLALDNLDLLRRRGESDPVRRYLGGAGRDAALLRRLARRNLHFRDLWEARALLEGDASSEAAALRREIERALAEFEERRRSTSDSGRGGSP